MDNFDPGTFVKAVQQGNQRVMNQDLAFLSRKLVDFLTKYCNAPAADAQDCTQEAFFRSLPSIRDNRIRDHHKVYAYLKRAALNNYFKLLNKYKRMHCVPPSEKNYFFQTPPNHHYNLIEEEFFKQFILCLQALSPKHRNCIHYWLLNPEDESHDLAKYFDISLSNAYTRKSRAIGQLQEEMEQYQPIKDLKPHLKKELYKRLPEKYNEYKTGESFYI